jgi:hypothetical protein
MFIEELRGSALHRDSVSPSYERRLSQTGPWTRILISTQTLRADDRWKQEHPRAAAYLAKLGHSFDIQQVIGEYFEQVNAFREWLFQRLRQMHANDVEEANAIRAEIEALGASADPWLAW